MPWQRAYWGLCWHELRNDFPLLLVTFVYLRTHVHIPKEQVEWNLERTSFAQQHKCSYFRTAKYRQRWFAAMIIVLIAWRFHCVYNVRMCWALKVHSALPRLARLGNYAYQLLRTSSAFLLSLLPNATDIAQSLGLRVCCQLG